MATALPLGAESVPLSEINAGSETVTLIPNGDFEDDSSGNVHTPTGWSRNGDMFYNGDERPAGVNTPNTGNGLARIHMDGGNLGKYQQYVDLEENTEYVLSAYMWNLGDETHDSVAVIDLNDAENEAQFTLVPAMPDADGGYFFYGSFNTTDTGARVRVRAFMPHPGITEGWPYHPSGALWDNIAITKASEFVPPSSGSSAFQLVITPADGGGFNLTWVSREGMHYHVWSTPDLSEALVDWDPVESDIEATGPITTTHVDLTGTDLFYRVEEVPPPPLLEAGFEDDDGDFSPSKLAGTDWAHGTPNSTGFGGQTVTGGNNGSAKCWGTNIGNPGHYLNPTIESCLRSTVIDLSGLAGAKLTFAQARDFPPSDTAVVNIIDVATGNPIVSGPFPLRVDDLPDMDADWNNAGPYVLPVGGEIQIEWCLSGTGGTTADYMGWYIDDVKVTRTIP